MRTKKEMRHYLRQWRGHSPLADFVLRKGQWFMGRAESDDYEIALEWRRKQKPQPQECYFNSQQFCSDCHGFHYFEGYYFIGGTPIEHAWVVMDDGKVVDFTIEALERKAKQDRSIFIDPMTPLYCGVAIPRYFIVQQTAGNGGRRPLAELYYSGRAR